MNRTRRFAWAPLAALLGSAIMSSCGGGVARNAAGSDAAAGQAGGTTGSGTAGGGAGATAIADAGAGGADGADLASLTFALPKKTYAFDSATFGIPAGNSVAVPCGGAALVQDCCNPPAPASGVFCSAQRSMTCESSVCTFHQVVAVVRRIDFKSEVAALASLSQRHLANVSWSTLDYAVTSNTLNVTAPTLDLYLAPDGVTTLPNAAALEVGTVPSIPAGQTSTGAVVRAASADATISSLASDLGTSFNLLVATTIVVPSGSPTPTGALSLAVTGSLTATLAP